MILWRVALVHRCFTFHGRSTSLTSKNKMYNQSIRKNLRKKIACLLIQYGANIHSASKSSYLSQACATGSLSIIRALLDKGLPPDVGAMDNAFHYYTYRAYLNSSLSAQDRTSAVEYHVVSRQMISLLRAHGAHLSPYQAVELGDMAELKAQLEAGTPADAEHGSALDLAAQKGNVEAVKLLFAHGANVDLGINQFNNSTLCAAASNGNLTIMKLLLAHGAKVNVGGYETPLYAAIFSGRANIASLLLAHGADPNYQPSDRIKFSVLEPAIRRLPQIVPYLLKHGADVNEGNGEPLRAAIEAHRLDLVRELLRRGANVNPSRHSQPKDFNTAGYLQDISTTLFSPLAVAIVYAPECTETVRRAGGVVNAQDRQIGLSVALKDKRLWKQLPRLLTLGWDANTLDYEGETLLTYALLHAPTEVKTLLEHGVDPNIVSRSQLSPLVLATKTVQEESVRLLLAHGAKPDRRVERGHTALYWARKHHLTNIIALLQQAGATVDN